MEFQKPEVNTREKDLNKEVKNIIKNLKRGNSGKGKLERHTFYSFFLYFYPFFCLFPIFFHFMLLTLLDITSGIRKGIGVENMHDRVQNAK